MGDFRELFVDSCDAVVEASDGPVSLTVAGIDAFDAWYWTAEQRVRHDCHDPTQMRKHVRRYQELRKINVQGAFGLVGALLLRLLGDPDETQSTVVLGDVDRAEVVEYGRLAEVVEVLAEELVVWPICE